MSLQKTVLAAVVLTAIAAFFLLDLGRYFNLETLEAHRAQLQQLHTDFTSLTLGAFFLGYVAITALSLPGAAIMTLAAGAVFGLVQGIVLVSFASTIGATLALLTSRYLFRSAVKARFGHYLERIDKGVRKEGAWYLFGLRLVPAFPFFIINLVMGLTAMGARTFYWVSQLGMLPGTVLYVNAGTQLSQLESVGGLMSPSLLISFAALGLFPLLARKAWQWTQQRRQRKVWPRPQRFDRDLVVIGAGSGGLVSAYIGAAVGARVSLIEANRMGGDCLNTGCVPSKTLIHGARLAHQARNGERYGVTASDVRVDFTALMARIREVIGTIEPHDSIARYRSLGVDARQGYARITSPWTVEVDGTELTTRNIIVATGARPRIPDIPGLDDVTLVTSDSIWELEQQPARLAVMGGGPIGSELAQAFARLGTQVTQIERHERLLGREDVFASEQVLDAFRRDGVRVMTSTSVQSAHRDGEHQWLCVQTPDGEARVEFDVLLVATGRQANVTGFGLEALDVGTTPQGTIAVNRYLQTRHPNIFAVGDVAGPYQFTHAASHQAWHAAVNALFGTFKRFAVDYSSLPRITFTDPEVAQVGLTEAEAVGQGIAHEVTRYNLAEFDRAIAEGAEEGCIKVLTAPGKDRILGATIVGSQAGALISEYVTAMRHGLGMNKLLSTIHAYPAWSEASKLAAGSWKRAHAPQRVIRWLMRYHHWRRAGTWAIPGPLTHEEQVGETKSSTQNSRQ